MNILCRRIVDGWPVGDWVQESTAREPQSWDSHSCIFVDSLICKLFVKSANSFEHTLRNEGIRVSADLMITHMSKINDLWPMLTMIFVSTIFFHIGSQPPWKIAINMQREKLRVPHFLIIIKHTGHHPRYPLRCEQNLPSPLEEQSSWKSP